MYVSLNHIGAEERGRNVRRLCAVQNDPHHGWDRGNWVIQPGISDKVNYMRILNEVTQSFSMVYRFRMFDTVIKYSSLVCLVTPHDPAQVNRPNAINSYRHFGDQLNQRASFLEGSRQRDYQ